MKYLEGGYSDERQDSRHFNRNRNNMIEQMFQKDNESISVSCALAT